MARRLRIILGAAHAGPSLVVTLVVAVLGIVSGLEPWRVAVLSLMMAANQLSIGWSNDAIDAERDIDAARPDKPVARGEVDARTLLSLAATAAALAIGISLILGAALAVVHALALAVGWLYNAGAKRTIAATACYVVAFASLPLMVTLARDDPRPATWWAMAMGGLLGLAAHFANVLPDLDDDRRHGIRSLPHRLGARWAGGIALAALAGAGVLGVVGPGIATPVTVIGATATVALLVAGIVVLARAVQSRALFRIIMLAALAAVVTLAGAAGSIVA